MALYNLTSALWAQTVIILMISLLKYTFINWRSLLHPMYLFTLVLMVQSLVAIQERRCNLTLLVGFYRAMLCRWIIFPTEAENNILTVIIIFILVSGAAKASRKNLVVRLGSNAHWKIINLCYYMRNKSMYWYIKVSAYLFNYKLVNK